MVSELKQEVIRQSMRDNISRWEILKDESKVSIDTRDLLFAHPLLLLQKSHRQDMLHEQYGNSKWYFKLCTFLSPGQLQELERQQNIEKRPVLGGRKTGF